MDPNVIAELTTAVHNLVLYHTPLPDGIKIEATQLAGRWKLAGRSLFDSSKPDLTLLLAALVVALGEDHKLLELIRQHRPEELAKLIRESHEANAELIASGGSSTDRTLTARQRHERKRSKWNRTFSKSIEYQFGGGLEHYLDWRLLLSPLLGPSGYKDTLRRLQTCLDDIFAEESVNMLSLEELFWMDRHRFAKPLRGFRKRPLNYLAVTSIMDYLLKEKPRAPRKKPGRGRPRAPWLKDRARRLRVLSEIEARINSRSMNSDVANAFLNVIRRHLRDSGKK